jgi:uncharacterized membrane protein
LFICKVCDNKALATLSQAKTLGGIGAILIFIPFVSFVGYILVIIAVKDIADELQDRSIFNNILIAAATGIVGAIAGGIVIIGVVGTAFIVGVSAILGVITGLLIVWVFLIISALFLRRAYATIAARLGIGLFRTAATLYLIGAALTIVLVGFVVLFFAEILQAVAYFSIPDQLTTQSTATQSTGWIPGPAAPATPSMLPQDGATKLCTYCGSKIAASATFCNNCGAKQP